MIDLKAIRDVASVTSDSERMQFKPSTVTALLDRLEAAEKALAEPAVEHVVTLCVKRDEYKLTLHYKGEEVALDLPDGEYKLYTSPPPPAEVPLLTTDEYTALAHRIASDYRHSGCQQHIAYTFLPHTLEQFVREIERATRQKAGLV